MLFRSPALLAGLFHTQEPGAPVEENYPDLRRYQGQSERMKHTLCHEDEDEDEDDNER